MTPTPTIAALATMPDRTDVLRDTVESILPQVDQLKVYLNGHGYIPRCLNHPKISHVRDRRNKGDAMKFYFLEGFSGYYFSLDDDLILPPDYVETMKAKIEHYGRTAVIGLHGRILSKPIRGYHNGQHTVLHCLHGLANDTAVHILGTGLMAFHTDTIKINMRAFPAAYKNMADIHFGIAAQIQRIPMIAIERPPGWITHNPKMGNRKTIHKERVGNDTKETAKIKRVKWRIHPAKKKPLSTDDTSQTAQEGLL